ncbi:MAG: glycosyltransferase [Parcubacteria group bacterium]|nr:glycosyltransferase [Parcubacteria group bacterium]
MKTSVLIIAHNEEEGIKGCIESVLAQTKPADEVVLVVHNSTDRTLAIAQDFPITVLPYKGPAGAAYARMRGIAAVTGDMIICTDGDTVVAPNWIEVMADTLNKDGNILVGSLVYFSGTILASVQSFYFKYVCVSKGIRATEWVWGPSMAFWAKDKEYIQESFKKGIDLSKQLNLSRNPDDYWFSLFMHKRGPVEVTNKTWVTAKIKETSSLTSLRRHIENVRNGKKMRSYFLNTQDF